MEKKSKFLRFDFIEISIFAFIKGFITKGTKPISISLGYRKKLKSTLERKNFTGNWTSLMKWKTFEVLGDSKYSNEKLLPHKRNLIFSIMMKFVQRIAMC